MQPPDDGVVTDDSTVVAAPAAPATPAPPPAPGDPAPRDDGRERTTLWRRPRRSVPSPRPRRGPVANLLLEPRGVLGIADFHELRREGLFDDCGRNPPPSWWAR